MPSFYDVTYKEDGRIEAVTPNRPGIPPRVTKAIVTDMDSFTPPENFVVPLVGAVQDLKVQVRAGGVAGLPHGAQALPRLNLLTLADKQVLQMGIDLSLIHIFS